MIDGKLAKITFEDHGLFANHDMPCSVCHKEAAVYEMQDGFFQPCWKCQYRGWRTSKPTGFWGKLIAFCFGRKEKRELLVYIKGFKRAGYIKR